MLKILEEWEEDMKNAEEKIKGTDDINIINAVRGLQTMVSQLKDIVNTQK